MGGDGDWGAALLTGGLFFVLVAHPWQDFAKAVNEEKPARVMVARFVIALMCTGVFVAIMWAWLWALSKEGKI